LLHRKKTNALIGEWIMNRTTIDFGIDLGTTNSAIAVMKDGKAEVIKNNDNAEITPSAVWLNEKNQTFVGKRAKSRIETEPDNAVAEFKLQMGTPHEYRFQKSGKVLRPQELSAEVLKSLRKDVQQRLGEDLTAAVITVPAAFELPQCNATKQAAELSGIRNCTLIMEPTAAAMTYAFHSSADNVFWLVYDFGGGTFDAAVIHVKDGNFRIVNHAGDNYLGGKLIDWAIVENILAPAAAREYKFSNFTRNNAAWQLSFAKLKMAAEDAKISLSQNETFLIDIDLPASTTNKGETVAFQYDLTRKEVIGLASQFITRSINISRNALQQAKLAVHDIERVILVGGPTLAPYLRERLTDKREGLGIHLDFSVDPLTVVAQGAAYFASTQRPDPDPVTPLIKDGYYGLDLQYDPVGSDSEPVVGGKVISPDGSVLSDFSLEFEKSRSGTTIEWRSGKISLNADGNFMTTLWVQERGITQTFNITLIDPTGRLCKLEPNQLTYTIGNIPTAPPLIHSIGVALANNKVEWFIKKGTPLPAKKQINLRTAVELRRGNPQTEFRVPVIEGNNNLADRNPLIGALVISPSDIKRDLPGGSEIEVTLEIDQNRDVKFAAYIPILDEEYKTILKLEKPNPDIKQIDSELNREKRRLEEVQMKAASTHDSAAQQVLIEKVDGENMVGNVETALRAASGDPDASDKAQKRLLDLKVAIDEAENYLKWPVLEAEVNKMLEDAKKLVNDKDPQTQQRLRILEDEARQSINIKNVDQLNRVYEEISLFVGELMRGRPEFWVGFFKYLCERIDTMRDINIAIRLVEQGNRAIQSNDIDRLRVSIQQLYALLPADAQEAAEKGGYGSGVIR